jgi:probable rRNA maturation factor
MLIGINNKTKSNIDLNLVEQTAKKFLLSKKLKNKEISIAFVGDQTIRNINKKYRHIDKVTDVLSFNGENNFLGEIIINYRQIKRQAKKYKKTLKQELIFILVHGLLHLIGYNDHTEDERKRMVKLGENFIKNNFNIDD